MVVTRMTKDAVLNVAWPDEIKRALQEAALKDDRSASSMVTRILREWLAGHGYFENLPVEAAVARQKRRSMRANPGPAAHRRQAAPRDSPTALAFGRR